MVVEPAIVYNQMCDIARRYCINIGIPFRFRNQENDFCPRPAYALLKSIFVFNTRSIWPGNEGNLQVVVRLGTYMSHGLQVE